MANPTRTGRLAVLRQLLQEARYTSQGELIDALGEHGIVVSQPTLSKDLLELGAVRQRAVGGALVYAAALEEGEDAVLEKLARLCAELLQSIRHAGTQILIKTPPGAAQYFASYLDQACLHGVLGTIAGDDTLLVIATDDEAAESTVGQISEMTRTGRPAEREQL
ncbi:arginine repressor [Tessaracoccus palaemonis]|uniref:Arginine repressor n=1 Tax=Tessaracoccus palaemonis TaxID=2829499 RepID=A0ABX8SLW6_9ACTN|nr:arginine repressor [Tessaracoccus palaemonis]QXT63889.1 arginine repressor [Tessaracoccus palaemonis]